MATREQIPFYPDPIAESTLQMGPSGGSLVQVSGAALVSSRLENEFDRQRRKGANFARPKFLGIAPAEFTVHFTVLPEDEAHFWARVVPLLRQKGKNGTSPPTTAVNPQINRLGIDTVTVLTADIDPPDARRGRQVTLKLREWTPGPSNPKPANKGKQNRDPLNPAANPDAGFVARNQ